jgi:monoamine oxidase
MAEAAAMGVSRRQFFHRVGALGGYGAAYTAIQALGFDATPAAAAPLELPPDIGKGAHVLVLGAGIAGLVSAYELERAGFKATVLEARERTGGRNWTIRNGTRVVMNGEPDQVAAFSKDLYFNAGPARLPSHHQGVLGYCKRLGVALEVEVNASRGALLAGSGPGSAAPLRMRQAINDVRGHVSELLAKAINKGALDEDISVEDRVRLAPFLKAYGDLNDAYLFKGTERSGFRTAPGAATDFGTAMDPRALTELLANDQLPSILFEDQIEMQATMFQPVGGMDRIPHAFEQAIRSPIIRQAEVEQIRQPEGGVSVVYKDLRTGKRHALSADYAIVTIPLVVLARIDCDFEPAVQQAIAAVPYDHANKTAFEAPRFWEREQIYGGISFVGGDTSLVWYPSAGLHTDRGVLVATYSIGPGAERLAGRPAAEQIAAARSAVARLHPGHEGELEKPIVINWSKVPYNLGPWPRWVSRGAAVDTPGFRRLNEPCGRVYFTGAHLSQMGGWQEGAVLSAHRTLDMLSRRMAQSAATSAA